MIDVTYWLVFIFILARMAAFMSVAPFFSIRGVPNLVKVGLSFLISITMLPLLPDLTSVVADISAPQLIFLLINEVLVGLLLGYTSFLIFQSIRIAGQLIDIQIGLSMASLFDPQSSSNSTLIGTFLYNLAILNFMIINGHHSLIAALAKSYSFIPVGGFSFQGNTIFVLIDVFRETMLLGLRVAFPIIAVLLIVDISVGLVARTVPQLNVFMLGFPIKLALGIICLAILSPMFANIFQNLLSFMEKDIHAILRSF